MIMNKKQESLAQIAKIMRDNGLTLVEVNDYLRRVAYVMARDGVILDEAVKQVQKEQGN